MSAYKLETMRELYDDFDMEFKEVLSKVRVFKYSDYSILDKENKTLLQKEYKALLKTKKSMSNKLYKTLKNKQVNICKSTFADFCMELDILNYDLETADNEIDVAGDEAQYIINTLDDLKKSKKKGAKKKIEKYKARERFFYVSRKKIKSHYDAISASPKFGLKAIKIRKEIDKDQKRTIKSIDKKITKLYKIVTAEPKMAE